MGIALTIQTDASSGSDTIVPQAASPWGALSVRALSTLVGDSSQGTPPGPRATDVTVTRTPPRLNPWEWVRSHLGWVIGGAVVMVAGWFILRKKG